MNRQESRLGAMTGAMTRTGGKDEGGRMKEEAYGECGGRPRGQG